MTHRSENPDHALDRRSPELPGVLPRRTQRIAWVALGGGLVITGLKFGVFWLTNSAAALSDALESIINLVTASLAVVSTWYASRPPDREHPYGHGNIEFVAVGVEGALIVFAGGSIIFESVRRLVAGAELRELALGAWLMAGVGVLAAVLGLFVYRMGRRYASPTLVADGKHLMTDVATTVGVVIGLILVRATGLTWLDAAFAIALAIVIFITGGKLLRDSWHGLMDRIDEADDAAIRRLLDREVEAGRIASYHKVKHRHQGSFHWVDLHVQVPGEMSVDAAHDVASDIEHRIEMLLDRANATAHIEPVGAERSWQPDPADR